MPGPNPFDDTEAFDTLTIGGLAFSGTFEFTGDALKRKLDRRHSPGRDGARIRDKGYDVAEIDLRLTIIDATQWGEMEAIVRLLFPRSRTATQRNAHACPHPLLALAGITDVYATTMPVVKQSSPTQWEATLKLVEYRADAQSSNTSHTPAAAPDIGANRTAFDIAPADQPPAPPATPGPGTNLTP